MVEEIPLLVLIHIVLPIPWAKFSAWKTQVDWSKPSCAVSQDLSTHQYWHFYPTVWNSLLRLNHFLNNKSRTWKRIDKITKGETTICVEWLRTRVTRVSLTNLWRTEQQTMDYDYVNKPLRVYALLHRDLYWYLQSSVSSHTISDFANSTHSLRIYDQKTYKASVHYLYQSLLISCYGSDCNSTGQRKAIAYWQFFSREIKLAATFLRWTVAARRWEQCHYWCRL